MNEIEAIKRLKECIEDCTSGEDEVYKEAFGMAILALEAQQKDKWIPVSERLPDKTAKYLITVKYQNFSGIHINITLTKFYSIENEWEIVGARPVIANEKIIAWRELPEPYKEVQP